MERQNQKQKIGNPVDNVIYGYLRKFWQRKHPLFRQVPKRFILSGQRTEIKICLLLRGKDNALWVFISI